MRRAIIFIICMIPAISSAESLLVDRVVSVYDGDTFKAKISGQNGVFSVIPVRIVGIDTPEIKAACEVEHKAAIAARDALRERLYTAKKIELHDVKTDKYFRLLATVSADGRNVASEMIKRGHGRVYFGGKRKGWCE